MPAVVFAPSREPIGVTPPIVPIPPVVAVPPASPGAGWVEVPSTRGGGSPYRAVTEASPEPGIMPGVAPLERTGGPGFAVPELDEQELRSGRLAAGARGAERNASKGIELPAEEPARPAARPSPAAPARAGWTDRLKAVMREALAARYSPTGTTLKGGLSPGGLVHWVFRRMGVRSVPQLVEDQMEMAGERIEAQGYRPQVGDLLFFSIGKLRHAGIYFDAEQNTFITVVPSKGGVMVADFDHPFFRARFLFARRVSPVD